MANFAAKLTFNDQQYEVNLYIHTGGISLTEKNDFSKIDALVPPDCIVYIGIENSIDDFVPTLELEIVDIDNMITNAIKPYATVVTLNLGTYQETVSQTNGSELAFDGLTLNFIVKDIRIKEITTDQIVYHIWCDFDNTLYLDKICEYATGCDLLNDNEMMENPYSIARNILLQAGYPMFPTTKQDSSGKAIPSRYDIPYTNEYCHFITSPNTTVSDAVKYLLSYAVR